MSSATAASPTAASGCIPTTTKPRWRASSHSARRAGTAKFGIQIAHSGRKGSAQKPWEGGGAAQAGGRSVADHGRFADSVRRGLADAARGDRSRHGARARCFRLGHPARAAHRLRRNRTAHGARLSGARLHVADFQQAHRPIRRLVRKPPALSALDRARGARRWCRRACRSARASRGATGARAG